MLDEEEDVDRDDDSLERMLDVLEIEVLFKETEDEVDVSFKDILL